MTKQDSESTDYDAKDINSTDGLASFLKWLAGMLSLITGVYCGWLAPDDWVFPQKFFVGFIAVYLSGVLYTSLIPDHLSGFPEKLAKNRSVTAVLLAVGLQLLHPRWLSGHWVGWISPVFPVLLMIVFLTGMSNLFEFPMLLKSLKRRSSLQQNRFLTLGKDISQILPETTVNQQPPQTSNYQKAIIRQSSIMLMLGGIISVLFGFRLGVGAIVLGLGGLFRVQKQQAGWLGLIGFVISLISSSMLFGLQVVNVLLTNMTKAPMNVFEIMPPIESIGSMAIIYWIAGLASFGYIIFGMGMLRAGVMPHTSVILLIVGSILLAFNPERANLGGIIVGVAFAWMGFHERQISRAWSKRSP